MITVDWSKMLLDIKVLLKISIVVMYIPVVTPFSTLENKIPGEKIKNQFIEERKTCFSLDMNVLPGRNNTLQFIQQKISSLTDSMQKLKELSGKANEVYNVLCRKFDKKSVEKSEQGRKKWRKEQNKKKRQKRQRSQEKHTIKFLSVISSASKHFFSHPRTF